MENVKYWKFRVHIATVGSNIHSSASISNIQSRCNCWWALHCRKVRVYYSVYPSVTVILMNIWWGGFTVAVLRHWTCIRPRGKSKGELPGEVVNIRIWCGGGGGSATPFGNVWKSWGKQEREWRGGMRILKCRQMDGWIGWHGFRKHPRNENWFSHHRIASYQWKWSQTVVVDEELNLLHL